MSHIKSAVLNLVKKSPELPVAIAYSGGLDSQVLMNVVCDLKREGLIDNPIKVFHVNHGLSSNAKSWSDFAKAQCAMRKVAIEVLSVSLNLQSKESLEAQARDARYSAISATSNAQMLVMTGHHKDDQAETFLLALKRGAGVKGLSAMQQVSRVKHHILARPLLSVSRNDLRLYAEEANLTWVEDESNLDTSFDRNFLRQDIIPSLTARWPGIVDTINRSASHCQQTQVLLNELAALDLKKCQSIQNNALVIDELKTLSTERFNNLLRYFLMINDVVMPSTAQLNEVAAQIEADADKTPQVKVGTHWLRRFKQVLCLTPTFADVTYFSHEVLTEELEQHPQQQITLPDGLGQIIFCLGDDTFEVDDTMLLAQQKVLLSKGKQTLQLSFKHNNPSILPSFRQHHRSLKKVMQEINMPTWQRKRTPFLYIDEELAAVAGQFVCKQYLPEDGSRLICVYWLKSE